MTTTYDSLFSETELVVAIAEGYVKERHHPLDTDLVILNYAEKAQYEKHWDNITLNCRGLIVRRSTHEIVARPWPKFFNYGEHPEGSLDLDAPVEVTNKEDGSLGILYQAPDGWAIATRGSFTSDQAIHATALLRERYLPMPWTDWPAPLFGLTDLFEIIYSDNRIVLDYGDLDDLIHLGSVDIETGVSVGPGLLPKAMPHAGILSAKTLREALALEPRPNAEGVVVRFCDSGLMVKIKQDDYVALHKIVTGLNERVVWEHLSAHNGEFFELLAKVPDEFHEWITSLAVPLLDEYESIQGRALWAFHELADIDDRKEFALRARADYPGVMRYLFLLRDGRELDEAIWKAIKPKGEAPAVLEQVAA